MIGIRLYKKPKPGPVERVRQWAARVSPCSTCGKVRAAVGKVVGAPKESRQNRII